MAPHCVYYKSFGAQNFPSLFIVVVVCPRLRPHPRRPRLRPHPRRRRRRRLYVLVYMQSLIKPRSTFCIHVRDCNFQREGRKTRVKCIQEFSASRRRALSCFSLHASKRDLFRIGRGNVRTVRSIAFHSSIRLFRFLDFFFYCVCVSSLFVL